MLFFLLKKNLDFYVMICHYFDYGQCLMAQT